jgi:DNA-binding transcriptional ArsR family regulator
LTKFFVKNPKIPQPYLIAIMSSGIASLHKILKDETRSQILLLLSEKGGLSYTDLMDTLGIVSTGTLNYHLKVLGDLVAKNESGQYTLTERGKVASRLLLEFPEKSQSQIEAELPRALFVGASLLSALYAAIVFRLYFLGHMDFAGTVTSVFWAVAAVILLFVFSKARRKRAEWSPRRQMLAAKLSVVFAGACAGTWVGFFGGGLLLRGLITLTPRLNPFVDLAFWVLNPIFGAILGGVVGYLIYKRSKISKAAYYDPFA